LSIYAIAVWERFYVRRGVTCTTERDSESGIYRRGAAGSCERKRTANVCLQVRSLLRRASLLEEI
jgi:hypothetical protein